MEWIDLDEREPEIGQDVILLWSDGYVCNMNWEKRYCRDYLKRYDCSPPMSPTHFMPFIKPEEVEK